MTDPDEITGTLEYWSYDNLLHVIWGNINGDTRGRFVDGQRIHTSSLLIPRKFGALNDALYEGSVVNTRNSRYRLGKKLNDKN